MQNLIKVIKIVSDKYMDKVNLIISNNYLTLEYLEDINGEKDVAKSVKIEEFEDKLKITPYPERIEKIINVNEIEDIIQILEKQCKVQKHSQEEIKYIRDKYKQGTKIELIKMYDFQAVPTGTKGTIDFVDDMGTIHMRWETGSTLGLIIGKDEFKVLDENAEEEIDIEDEDIEKLKKDSRTKILENFDEEFGSMLKNEIKDFPTLITIFHDYLEDTFKTGKLHNLILDKILEIEDELQEHLTPKGKELFEKWELYRDELENFTAEQSFIYGYCLDKELSTEKNSKKEVIHNE